MAAPAICEKGGGGIALPLFGDLEQEWPRPLRIVLYLVGLFWCFMGVALIADVFMAAIEKVTSKKIRCVDSENRAYTYQVWNDTIANLTLMALGSSAPEILLNVIDIFAKDFYLEGLGPSTIVGSAAFNLLIIIAVCIISLPNGEVRFIKDMSVYRCTATWSILAYVWLIVILLATSPHVVQVWEGVVTFLFFPALVLHAWLCDKGWCGKPPAEEPAFSSLRRISVHEGMSCEELAEAECQVRAKHGQNLTSQQVARILAVTNAPPKSRAQYRIYAIRSMFGGRRLRLEAIKQTLSKQMSFTSKKKVAPLDIPPEIESCTFEFKIEKYAVLENGGEVILTVSRAGCLELPSKVYYQTVDGAAQVDKDYMRAEGWLHFEPGVEEAEIKVRIVDDAAYEEDEEFFVELSEPTCEGRVGKLGAKPRATVVIIDDDEPGILCFTEDTMTVTQGSQDMELQISVQRMHGSCGHVTVEYQLEDDTARRGVEFDGKDGELEFLPQQVQANIPVTIKAVARYNTADRFRIILSKPTGGAKFDPKRDGGSHRHILTVTIEADEETRERVDHLHTLLRSSWDKSKVGHANWASQFRDAILVNGGVDDESDTPPSLADKAMHCITMPWKLLFALVPPTDYCGGWVCFFCALVMIGFVTMIIGDMASLLGCVMCIPDEITAITFVALGTSLPDTFASKQAAQEDPHADASVGNVTGSNSVNVFLGLGLPWMIAAIAWQVKGADAAWDAKYQTDPELSWLGSPGSRGVGFVVKAGSLAFSVSVFSSCAVLCLGLLAVRRRFCGGELGGAKTSKWLSAIVLMCLWLVYVGLSSWKSLSESGSGSCPS